MKKPWFWKARKAWFVTSEDGQSQIFLDADEAKAYERWRELSEAGTIRSTAPAMAVIQLFLMHAKKEFAPESYENHRYYLVDFVNKFGTVLTCDLKPAHITKWLAGRDWSDSTRRTAISRVKRAFAWAVEEKHIESSPLAGVKRPPESRRERLVTADEHKAMMTAGVKGHKLSKRVAALRPVLIALKHSGARPGTVAAVAVENVSPVGDAWVMAKHKTAKKTKRPLVVYLSPCLQTLTKIAVAVRGEGRLFLNAQGKPWTRNAVRQRMRRLRKALGMDDVVSYSYRHTYITNALLAGVDMAVVAQLSGHSSLEMIAKHYSHLSQATEYLKKAAAKAVKRDG